MKTRTFLLGAVASLALTGTANAREMNGWYVGLEAGGNWIEDSDVVEDGFLPPAITSFDTGWAALGTVGYGWHNWRAELEFGYRSNEIDTVNDGAVRTGGGKFDELSAMFNILYDLPLTEKMGLFVGAGAGGDFIDYENNTTTHVGVLIHDDDAVFAWQAMGGVNYQLTSSTDLFLAYRYFNADSPSFATFGGILHTDDFDNVVKHTATIGLRYHFGAPAPAPMAEAPPPPPPMPPEVARQFIVFFAFNKCNITSEADGVLGQAADTAKQTGSAAITITGHTDTTGSPKYNQKLSECRANAAKTNLVGKGIAASSIGAVGRGEGDLLVQTADGVKEPQNRRAQVDLE